MNPSSAEADIADSIFRHIRMSIVDIEQAAYRNSTPIGSVNDKGEHVTHWLTLYESDERDILRRLRNAFAHNIHSISEDGTLTLTAWRPGEDSYKFPLKILVRIGVFVDDAMLRNRLKMQFSSMVKCSTCGEESSADIMLRCGHVEYGEDSADGKFLLMKPKGATLEGTVSMGKNDNALTEELARFPLKKYKI